MRSGADRAGRAGALMAASKRGVHFAAAVPDREPAEHDDGERGAEKRDDGQPQRTEAEDPQDCRTHAR